MRSIRKMRDLFWFAVMFFFLMSASILFMPIASQESVQNRKLVVLTGIVFWTTAIAGYVLIVIANRERKRLMGQKVIGMEKADRFPGIATFFTNVFATISDGVLIMSFLFFVVVNFTSWRYDYISYVLLFMLIFSLHMHCLFNGRIYKTIKYKCVRRESSHE